MPPCAFDRGGDDEPKRNLGSSCCTAANERAAEPSNVDVARALSVKPRKNGAKTCHKSENDMPQITAGKAIAKHTAYMKHCSDK
jgi:hypothetical protein